MARQHLIWTALPNGFNVGTHRAFESDELHEFKRQAGTALRLSVHVAPRLMPDPNGPQTLEQFEDFRRWTHLVAAAPADSYSVLFFKEGEPHSHRVKATRVDLNEDVRLDPDLWRSLFKFNTPVRPHEYGSLSDRLIRSYPVGSIAGFVEQRYRETARRRRAADRTRLDEGGLPVASLLGGDLFGPVSFTPDDDRQRPSAQTLTDNINGILTHFGAIPAAATAEQEDGIALDFMQARLFHTLLAEGAGAVKHEPPDYDFHDALSFLGQYPALLRKLGLIIDLEVPLDSLPDDAQDEGVSVSVVPDFASDLADGTTNFHPRTAYRLDAEHKYFRAAASPHSDLQNGLLKLGTDAYGVVQLDTDSAVELLLNFAYNLTRLNDPLVASTDAPKLAEPPALRTGGIALVRNDRAVQLHERFKKSDALNTEGITEGEAERLLLMAEDLVRGYRIDVLPDGAKPAWHSLCRRVGNYTFKNGGADEIEIRDEGFITTGVSQVPAKEGEQPAAKPDLFLHESLCRWDGWSLSAQRPGKTITNEEDAKELQNKDEVSEGEHKGKQATFLGLEASFKPQNGTLPRLRFGRRYRLRARAVDLAGNSLPPGGAPTVDETLHTGEVVYTRFEPVVAPVVVALQAPKEGESLERVVIRGDANSPATGVSERLLAPPRCSQLLAETHGMFDTPNGFRADAYKLIVGHEGSFPEPPANPDDPANVQPEPGGWYKLPYLPDPLAQGATFILVINDMPALFRPTQCNFNNHALTWPDALPWRLRLVEHTAPELPDPKAEVESRVTAVDGEPTMLIRLRKADVARLLVSSSIRGSDLELMGVWHWLNTPATEAKELETLKQTIPLGLHPMFTPGRLLTLVNAVQRPLQAPDLNKENFLFVNNGVVFTSDKQEPGGVSKVRELGDTFVNFIANLPVHARSTGKLDLHARWSEPVDDPREPAFDQKPRTGQAHVEEIPLPDPNVDTAFFTARHEFGDTKHRVVHYSVTATTRFREYFPPPPEGQEGIMTRTSETVARVIPNSARPAAPKVLYVVPIFKWRKTEHNGVTTSKRQCGLRVYLERPWYSSGDGEKLAVVLPNVPAEGLSEEVAPYVSQLGIDPTRTVSLAEPLTPENFSNRLKMQVAPELSLEELPPKLSGEIAPGIFVQQTQIFTIVPHNVAYNADRNLWYCDIRITPNNNQTYYPFVRLALVRYQHNSVHGAHLSRVALTDFIQLAPDRRVTVTRNESEAGLVRISATLTGVGHAGSLATEGMDDPVKLAKITQPVFMTLEAKSPIGHGDLGWQVIAKSDFFSLDASSEEQLTQTPPSTMLSRGGSISVKKEDLAGLGKLRLVIREYENYVHAADVMGETKMIPRLVFVDHINAFPEHRRAAD